MWAKFGVQIVIELLKLIPDLAYKAFSALRAYIDLRKKKKAANEAAERIEDATSHDTVRGSVDDLP